MTLQVRQFGSRLLLILALAAALLADIVTIQWVTSHSSLSQVVFTSIGNDSGGGKICPVGSLGGDSGGGNHRDVAQIGTVTDTVGGDAGGGR
jgi:hypothetical protein